MSKLGFPSANGAFLLLILAMNASSSFQVGLNLDGVDLDFFPTLLLVFLESNRFSIDRIIKEILKTEQYMHVKQMMLRYKICSILEICEVE